MNTLQQKVKMIQEQEERYNKQELHHKIITKTDSLFLEIESLLNTENNAAKWLELYNQAFLLVILFPDVIDEHNYPQYLFDRIVDFCKDKDDKSKTSVYRLFGFFWRLQPKLSKDFFN